MFEVICTLKGKVGKAGWRILDLELWSFYQRVRFVNSAQVGPATSSPNGRLIWFDVTPKGPVLNIRDLLHETGLFRADLPLTKGFVPHLTISEAQRQPTEVTAINEQLNSGYSPQTIVFDSLTWIIPDENFVFRSHQAFQLKTVHWLWNRLNGFSLS